MAAPVSTRRRAPVRRRKPSPAGPLLVLSCMGCLVGAFVGMVIWSFDVWAGLLVFPILTAMSYGIGRWIARRTGDPEVVGQVMFGWAIKAGGSLLRWWTAYVLYDRADARAYGRAGVLVAEVFRGGSTDLSDVPLRGGPTRVIEVATGVVYTITGPSTIAGFLVFGWVTFLGSLLLWRAFVLAVPDGLDRRYRLLIFLTPSIVYWPASVGKDAWVIFSLGVGAYGAARLLMHRRGGLVLLAAGCGIGSMVRPHVMLILGISAGVAWLLGRPPRRLPGGLVVKVVGGALLIVVCSFLFARVQEEYGGGSGRGNAAEQEDGVEGILDFTENQTSQGDSEFSAVRVRSPVEFPLAAVTVLARPFPWEAGNAQAVASALEGMFIGLLLLFSWKRILAAILSARRRPYLLLCMVYTFGFVIAFSTVGNFGILARQRVQVLPFVFALVCVQKRGTGRTPPVVTARRRGGQQALPASI